MTLFPSLLTYVYYFSLYLYVQIYFNSRFSFILTFFSISFHSFSHLCTSDRDHFLKLTSCLKLTFMISFNASLLIVKPLSFKIKYNDVFISHSSLKGVFSTRYRILNGSYWGFFTVLKIAFRCILDYIISFER